MAAQIIAHSANRDGRVQFLSEHLHNVESRMMSTLAPISLENLGRLLGFLHDIGKAAPDWQAYIHDPKNSKIHPGHSQYGRIAYNPEIFPLDSVDTEAEEDYRYAIAQVICSHHSTLYDDVDFDDPDFDIVGKWKSESLANACEDADVLSTCLAECGVDISVLQEIFASGYNEFREIWRDIRRRSAKRYGENSDKFATAVTFELNLLNALLLSALMDADWLDTQNHADCIYAPELQKTVEWSGYAERLEEHLSHFKADTDLNRKRIEISNTCLAASRIDGDHAVQKLSVFCGGGKTFSSMRYAVNHANLHIKRRIFYVIPYISIIEQNATALRNAFGLSDDAEGNRVLLEHHSNAGLDLDAKADDLNAGRDELSMRIVARYDAPIVMTTQVKFLDALFSNDKRTRRLLADYIDSEIIFDEFQAMPLKLLDMFYIAVEFLEHVMHCNIVLCSATQSISAQYGLSDDERYLTGVDWNEKYADTLGRADVIDLSGYSNPKKPVKTIASIRDLTLAGLDQNGSALVIANTRRQARTLFENINLSQDGTFKIFHLSTNMYPRHRREVLAKMITALQRGERVICVSTSLIEAGVDISFGTVVRYINGFDSIVQSGGRCNRHADSDRGCVYIVNEPTDSNFPKQQNATGSVIGEFGGALTDKINAGLALYYEDYLDQLKASDTGFPYKTESNVSYNTTLVELWGGNKQYCIHHPSNDIIAPQGELPQRHSMVRTAQRAFEAIGRKGHDVIVCLDRQCREWLDAYVNAGSYRDLLIAQQMLQQYSVSLSSSDYMKIHSLTSFYKNDILSCRLEVIRDDACYDPECGVVPIDDDSLMF